MKTPLRWISLVAGVVGCLMVLPVRGSSLLSYSNAVPGFGTYQATDFTNTVALPQFNSALGQLTGITFLVNSRIYSSIAVENTNLLAGSAPDVSAQSSFRVTMAASTRVLTNLVTTGSSFSLTSYDGVTDYAGTSGNTVTTDEAAQLRSLTLTGAALTPYIGSSNVYFLTRTVSGFSAVGGGNNLSLNLSTYGGAELELRYFYDEILIPEPGTLAALGMLAPLLLRRRRR
jgi:hypothetical protein